MRMSFSLAGSSPVVHTVAYPEATFDIYISKSVANGSREFYIDSDSYNSEPVVMEDIIPGIDMEMVVKILEDVRGLLYIGDTGDVDVSSVDNDGSVEVRFGDGQTDEAGSALSFSSGEGQSETSVGQSFTVPMDVYSTTGKSSSLTVAPGRRMNGSVMECQGLPFEKEGGVAPYVGTGATFVSTGSSLNRMFSGFRTDIQFMNIMQIEPIE